MSGNDHIWFDGSTYDPDRDLERLASQLGRVWLLMKDSQWRTLPEMKMALGSRDETTALSARLRDLRKQRFGGHIVERQYVRQGLWRYRLIPNQEPPAGAHVPARPSPSGFDPAHAADHPDPDGRLF